MEIYIYIYIYIYIPLCGMENIQGVYSPCRGMELSLQWGGCIFKESMAVANKGLSAVNPLEGPKIR